jgi:hypothetical protein
MAAASPAGPPPMMIVSKMVVSIFHYLHEIAVIVHHKSGRTASGNRLSDQPINPLATPLRRATS